jgi:serine/threonine-protein kinase
VAPLQELVVGVIGERVNNYEVKSLLGEGGMGAVYLAQHPFMGRKAAVKVLRRELAQDRGLVERFMNEARAANAIHHPNIIDIIDVGQLPSGIPYLMMEFLEGESLARRIEREGRFPVDAAIDVAMQTASALQAAHSKEIVHRDLKPDNLFLVPDEGQPFGFRVKVLDFGIAKLRGELSGSGEKTQTGSVMGTPPYMSPEQCRGITEEIDHRTDIYALGIILYEMVVGRPPFMSTGWGEVVLMHVTKPPQPPRERNPEVSQELQAIILKALAKPREDRFATMAELQAALRIAAGRSGSLPGTAGVTGPAGTMGRPSTTLNAAAGEVTPATLRVAARPVWRRPSVLVTGVLAAAGAAVAIGFLSGHRALPPVGPAPPVAAARPAHIEVMPPEPQVIAEPPKISVRVRSEPARALVTVVDTGAVLGTTPLEKRLAPERPLVLRVSKEGFVPEVLEVPPGSDFDQTVALERPQSARPRHHREAPPPSSAGHAVEAKPIAAPPVAPAPATQPAPAPAHPKPAAEKW